MAEQHPKMQISLARQQLDAVSRELQRATMLTSGKKKEALQYLQQRLANGSLQATLKRGYTILQNPHGRILERSVDALKEKVIRARFQDGEINLDVRHPGKKSE